MALQTEIARYFANENSQSSLRDAFSRRSAVMPFRGRQRVPDDEIQSRWSLLLTQDALPKKRLVYVHVPFCANHCLFCGFYRNAYVPDAGASYVDLIIGEIEKEASAAAVRERPVHAVYIGGGTPTALRADELFRLLYAIKTRLPLAADCEITVEGRIIHFDPEKIDACLEAGANRFSIGVQSFDTDVRRRQGRRSSRQEAITFLENLGGRDRAAVVIDLIYGLPGQTLDIWQQDLETATALGADGIDLYGLNVIPGTPLFTALAAGKFSDASELRQLGDFYLAGDKLMQRKNWRRLSNNHWGRTTRERNLYNLLIKEGADCLAYGAGAGGTLGAYSYGLTGELERYGEQVRAGGKPIAMLTVSDSLQQARDAVTAGFEVGRLDLRSLDAITGQEISLIFSPLLGQWQKAGLLTVADSIVELTVAGRFWYGNLISAFQSILTDRLHPSQDAA